MVDNVPITAGAGTNIATDDVGSAHYQKVKIGAGANASAVMLDVVAEDDALVGGETGLLHLVKRLDIPANLSGADGDAEVLQMSGGFLWVRTVSKFVTVSTDITRPGDTNSYAINDAISNSTSAPTVGGFTLTGAARMAGGSGIIQDAVIATSADAGTPLQGELFIFDQAVTNINDNGVFAVSDAEIKTLVGVIPFTLTDSGNNGSAYVGNLNIGFTTVGSANLRYLIRAKNAYAPANAEVITVRLKIRQID